MPSIADRDIMTTSDSDYESKKAREKDGLVKLSNDLQNFKIRSDLDK